MDRYRDSAFVLESPTREGSEGQHKLATETATARNL